MWLGVRWNGAHTFRTIVHTFFGGKMVTFPDRMQFKPSQTLYSDFPFDIELEKHQNAW